MVESIYQHYRKEEAGFIDQVFGWMQQVENSYAPYLTVFLTPREAMIIQDLVATNPDLKVSFQGGYEKAERTRALIYPLYFKPQLSDFSLAVLEIRFPPKFADLSHGKILGSLMSAGIERDRIGDIITDGTDWHIILDESLQEYYIMHVRKIGNVGVSLEPIPMSALLESEEQWEELDIVASSLRLDTLLSKVYNFSRERAKRSVASGLVKVNFAEVDRPDMPVGVHDIVSLRKNGRFWIDHIDGMTRKDNYRLTIKVLVS